MDDALVHDEHRDGGGDESEHDAPDYPLHGLSPCCAAIACNDRHQYPPSQSREIGPDEQITDHGSVIKDLVGLCGGQFGWQFSLATEVAQAHIRAVKSVPEAFRGGPLARAVRWLTQSLTGAPDEETAWPRKRCWSSK